MNKKFRAIFLLIFLLILFLIYTYINFHVENRVGESPDENLQLFFSKQIAEESSIFWHSDLNERYNTTIFRPRASIDIGNNNFMGPYLGLQLILALSRLYGFLGYINSLIAVLGILSLYLLCREVHDDKVGLISIVLFGLFPSYLYFANMYYSNIPALTFGMLSLYCFYKGIVKQNMVFLGFSGFFLSFAVHIRITEILFIVPMAVIYLLNRDHNGNLKKDIFLPGVLILAGTLGLWFIIQEYIKSQQIALSGTSIRSASSSTLVTNDLYSLIKFLVNQFIDNLSFYEITFKNFIFGYSPLLFILFLLGVVYSYKNEKTLIKRIFLYASVMLCLVYFLFYGYMSGTWNYTSQTWGLAVPVDASMSRYFLPIYAIFCVYAAVLLQRVPSMRLNQKFAVITVILISYLILNLNVLIIDAERLNRYGEMDKVVKGLPDDSVVFTKFYDKVLSLHSNVAVYRTQEDVEQDFEIKYFFEPLDIKNNVIPLIDKLLSSGVPVYVANDAGDLLESLKRNEKYNLEPIDRNKLIWKLKRG